MKSMYIQIKKSNHKCTILALLLIISFCTFLSTTNTYAKTIKCELFPKERIQITDLDDYNKLNQSNSKIVSQTLTKDGVIYLNNNSIKGLKKGKTSIVINYSDGSLDIIKVKVKNPITKIEIPQNKLSLNKGDTRKIYFNINNRESASKEPLIWNSSNKKVAKVNKKGQVTGLKNGTTYITCKSKYGHKTAKIKVYVKKTQYLAITFDDGPGIYTESLLKQLEKHNSKATFFVLGNRVKKYKDIIDKEADYNHQIANHSYSHPILTKLSKKDLKTELYKTAKLIEKYSGKSPTLLRPPYGAHNETVRKLSKTPLILWNVDTLDWKYKSKNHVKESILNNAKDGNIILLHDIHKTTVDGFVAALPILKKRGFELVTIEELYDINNKKLEDGVLYYSCR